MSQTAQNQRLQDTRRPADAVVTLVIRLVSRCILRSKDYFADPLFNGGAMQTDRPPLARKKLLSAKIAQTSRRSRKGDSRPRGIAGKDWGLPISFPSARTLMDKLVQYSPRVGGSADCRPTVRSRGPTNR